MALATLAMTSALLGVAPAPSGAGPVTAAAAAKGARSVDVTLLTGDRVRLTRTPDGRQSATVVPAPGRDGLFFDTTVSGGRLSLVPGDARPLLDSGALDPGLFDITSLAAQGYDDARTATIPLVASYDKAARSAPPTLPQGMAKGRKLPMVGGSSVKAGKRNAARIWRSLTGATVAPRGTRHLDHGIRKLWLDAKVTATGTAETPDTDQLDKNIKQIGAPDVWRDGADGHGATVAVLDSGVDDRHPDLAGRVAETANFTPESDSVDHNGHGTHVASTIAGSGAASDGRHKGVAPGTRLIVGKVLDTGGSGTTSDILEGMQWAADQGADIVSMSLGGPYASDGSDMLSQAVDRLSRDHDMLFVIAAGNSGPDAVTVPAPGAAQEALTVGAVDSRDDLASFSSRGPRLGDEAIKPEVVAPGVDITAARADGTTHAATDGPRYTTMSGTSMATPHTAGAAALLKSLHPDWHAQQIKSALIASAQPIDAPVSARGAGRIDVARAARQQLTADAATLNFRGEKATHPVTYHNDADHPVALHLHLALDTVSGTAAPERSRTLSTDRLTVPAHGSATAEVTVDPALLGDQNYAGTLSATGPGERLSTPLAADSGARAQVALEGTLRSGAAPDTMSMCTLWNLDTGLTYYFTGCSTTRQTVPAGRYQATGWLVDKAGSVARTLSVVQLPQVTVDGDTTFHLDARKAVKVALRTPRPADAQSVGLAVHRTVGQQDLTALRTGPYTVADLYVTPTDKPHSGHLDTLLQWSLAQPRVRLTSNGDPLFVTGIGNTDPADGTRELTAVDAGTGSADELAAADVRGKAALVRWRTNTAPDAQVAAARTAGAAVVLLWDAEGKGCMCSGASTSQSGITGLWLSTPDGARLTERIASGQAEVTLEGHPAAAYAYDLVRELEGHVPDSVTVAPTQRELARVDQQFKAQGASESARDARAAFVDGWPGTGALGQSVTAPGTRTDWVTPGVGWLHTLSTPGRLDFSDTKPQQYPAGERSTETWGGHPYHSALPDSGGYYAVRTEDAFELYFGAWQDSGGHIAPPFAFDTASYRFLRGGEVVKSGGGSGQRFPVTADPATYTYEITVNGYRNRPLSTRSTTAWTFRSQRPTDGPVPVKLLQVGYNLALDGHNSAAADDPVTGHIRFTPGPDREVVADSVTVEASYDDGRTWTHQHVVQGEAGTWDMTIAPPPAGGGNGFVALRTAAQDTENGAVTQTVTRAYALR
ncbi:S8 family peptidase [Streptomyces sp. NBC_00063]|uniref:S8 family peptidase n=2 Tax=Streptomyces sp. NBC_00063 TaxID=2975638 RepID=UPI003D755EAF